MQWKLYPLHVLKIGKAKYTVTFLGNYKGSAKLTGTFEIKAAPLTDAEIIVPDKAFLKPGKYISAPYVSIDGVTLTKKDYDVTYTIGSKPMTAKDKLTEDDLKNGSLEVTVTVTGKGNYASSSTAKGTYKITKVDADHDLSKAKVVIWDKKNNKKATSFAYTGSEIELGSDYELRVTTKSGATLKQDVDFTVNYANNVNKGKATVILTGMGDNSSQSNKYYGSKTTTFKIVKGSMKWL